MKRSKGVQNDLSRCLDLVKYSWYRDISKSTLNPVWDSINIAEAEGRTRKGGIAKGRNGQDMMGFLSLQRTKSRSKPV